MVDRHIAFVSATILLYCVSQMQLYNYPAEEWQAYMALVDNDLAMLEYCQELDPVASSLRDVLAQYMLIFQTTPLKPKPQGAPRRSVSPMTLLTNGPGPPPPPDDLVAMLLVIPARPKGMAQTSLDLLRLVCQPFNNATPSSPPDSARRSPSMPRDPLPGDPSKSDGFTAHVQHTLQVLDSKMPFGWQRHQTSSHYTEKATNVALTVEQEGRGWSSGR